MLSAFTARSLVELKQRDKSKIESVLAYDDRLLIGLSTGSLRIYRVNDVSKIAITEENGATDAKRPTSQAGNRPVDLLREVEKFAKYKIESLALVKEAGVLVSLSNGYVSLHNLEKYELREALARSKGASTFAVTSGAAGGDSHCVTRLAVAVKRRLLIWTWHNGELDAEPSETTLVTGIKSLTWVTTTRLVVGLNTSYLIFGIETSKVTDIIGPGSIGGAPGQDGGRFGASGVAGMGYLGMTAPKPMATKLDGDNILLAKDINTHFIDMEGQSLGRRQIPWAVAPEAIGFSHPYLLALQSSKGTLELRNPETLTLLQTVALPSASQLHILSPSSNLSGVSKAFLVLSDRCIWQMKAQKCDPQIDELVKRGRLDEAISLLGMMDRDLVMDKASRMREIKMDKAQILFDDRKFRDAIDLFTEVNAPPERVIGLYPPFIAGKASCSENQADLSHAHSLESEGRKSKEHKRNDLKEVAEDLTKSPKKPSKMNSDGDEFRGSTKHVRDNLLEGKDLNLATEELRGFLVSARTKMKNVLNIDGTLKTEGLEDTRHSELGSLLIKKSFDASADEEKLFDTAKLVDTTLFRAYMFVSPSFAGPLFRIDNFCDPDVVNEKLIEAGRYNDLVDFFYGKKLHRKALELLEQFGETEPSEAAPQLVGPQRTVAYLQNLPSEMIDLILQFAEWPLKKDPELAMQIFLADTENAETLPRAPVLEYLQGIDSNLAVQYLEHIIHELNDTTPAFHQRLVDVYIQGLTEDKFEKEEARINWREKSLEFLRSSKNYQAYKALNRLTNDDPKLYEARAIVLSNMGQYKQALDIYVFKLKDADKAEEYCNQIYLANATALAAPALQRTYTGRRRSSSNIDPEDAPPSIYHILLSLYLSPPPPHQPQWGPALKVLAKHGARMPASSTLDLIPEVLPIKDLESYFRGQIRSAKTISNENRVVAGLRSATAFSEEAKVRLGDGVPGGNGGRNRRVVITEDRVCGVCHKRFGGSAVKVLPDNTVVHYGCSTR